MSFFSPSWTDLEAGAASPPFAAEVLVLHRPVGCPSWSAVLCESVQGQRTCCFVQLVVAVAWQVVLAGEVVPCKFPLVLDVITGNHAFLKDPKEGRSP